MKLEALKRLRYPRGGRDGVEYGPGDTFEASDRDAKALLLVRAARPSTAPAGNKTDVPAAKVKQDEPEDDIVALRGDYETVLGKRPFMGWDAKTLKSKLNEYRRRDMRAED